MNTMSLTQQYGLSKPSMSTKALSILLTTTANDPPTICLFTGNMVLRLLAEPLTVMAKAYPRTCALYAKVHDLLDTPG